MSDGLICNQTKIPKEKWRYGFRSSAAVGCGWIATFNALKLMGYHVSPKALIRYYERQLPLIHGNAGTSFWGPALYFRKWGFPVQMVFRRQKFDEAAKTSNVCILFYHWHRGMRFGAHFVTVTYDAGGFTGYNTYRNSLGPDCYGPSLDGFLRKQKYYGAVLICIKDKR